MKPRSVYKKQKYDLNILFLIAKNKNNCTNISNMLFWLKKIFNSKYSASSILITQDMLLFCL